jgi:hypothetical protein
MTTYVVGGLVDRESVALSSFYIVPGRRLIQNVARLGVDFAAPWTMASAVWRNGHGRRATFVQPSHAAVRKSSRASLQPKGGCRSHHPPLASRVQGDNFQA